MKNHDFIPHGDADFDVFQSDFTSIVEPGLPFWGITGPDWANLIVLRNNWAAAWLVAKNKDNRTSADVQAKEDARKLFVKAIRNFVKRWIAANTLITDAQRKSMGLNVRDTEPSPVPVMGHAPAITIHDSQHLLQVVRLQDPANPDTHAMPHGQVVLIERFVGVAGLAEAAITFGNADTATRFLHNISFLPADVGKTVYYRCCYVNTKGQKGPFSTVLSYVVS